MAKKQKEAVVEAIISVLGDSFQPNSTIVKDVITSEQKSEIRDIIFNGILSGEIGYNKDLTNESEVRKYTNGLIDNHIRRAKELNGGTVYKPSREGTKRDAQLKELNKLLNSGRFQEGSEEYIAISSHIQTRKSQIAAERANGAPAAPVDVDMLPANLRGLVVSQEA